MGYRASASGLIWPVPREDLDAFEVLELEWRPDGSVVVRSRTPDAPPSSPRPARPATRLTPALTTRRVPEAAPLRIRLAWIPESMAAPAHRSQTARDKITWLGIGALVGIALAGSVITNPAPRGTSGSHGPISDTGSTLNGPAIVAVSGVDTSPVTTMAPPLMTFARGAPPTDRTRPGAAAIPMAVRPDAMSPAARPARPPQTRVTRVPAARPPSNARWRTPRAPAPVVRAVMREVRRYESAYTRMDAAAVLAVWPAADRQAVIRHFTGLREQRLQLGGCVVESPADTASVTCRGTLRFRPRVGDHTTRTLRGRWRFALDRQAEGWAIAEVHAPAGPTVPRPPYLTDARVSVDGTP